MTGQESRPGNDPRPASKAFPDAEAIVPSRRRIPRRLTGRVSLAGLDGHDLTRRVQSIADFPPGAAVRVIVGPGQHPPTVALDYLARHGQHLAGLEIMCSDPDTATEWDRALDEPPGVIPW